MQELMSNVVMVAGLLVPLISGLVEVIKKMDLIDIKFMPAIAVSIGFVCGLAIAFGFGYEVSQYVLAGVISGLASSGLYDNLKVGG